MIRCMPEEERHTGRALVRGPSSFGAERTNGAKRCRPTTATPIQQQEEVVGTTRNAELGTHYAKNPAPRYLLAKAGHHIICFWPALLLIRIFLQ